MIRVDRERKHIVLDAGRDVKASDLMKAITRVMMDVPFKDERSHLPSERPDDRGAGSRPE